MSRAATLPVLLTVATALVGAARLPAQAAVETPRAVSIEDVRPILAARCFVCHGPDENQRKGGPRGGTGLRLDTRSGLFEDLGGHAAVVAGDSASSELIRRITATDRDRMPPPGKGAPLAAEEVDVLRRWIDQGAAWTRLWSLVPPRRPELPEVRDRGWPHNGIDRFVLARLEARGLRPSPAADRYTLIRRVSLDLCGLPPTPEAAAAFVADQRPDAYQRLVDGLLAAPTFGERWAQPWLDLGRYADSAGYADDPPRTIWAWRDWVVRALNDNMPFDRFTVEQLAGDLLPAPTESQLVATALHRNTMTNSEGGTDDEEFRSAAIVDRVQTTMAVWMGSTIGCAQCHTHKYDPITQREFYRVYAIFNNTADADRRDEAPLLKLYTPEQRRRHQEWRRAIARLEADLSPDRDAVRALRQAWDGGFPRAAAWRLAPPLADDGDAAAGVTRLAIGDGGVTALRLELPPGVGTPEFALRLVDPSRMAARGRYVRVVLPGAGVHLHLAEVEVFRGTDNLARRGRAMQVSTGFDGPAELAIDGNTDGHFSRAKSTSHTAAADDPWWEVDLGAAYDVDRVVVWNRTDSDGVRRRLHDFRVELRDEGRAVVWSQALASPPDPSVELQPVPGPRVAIAVAYQAADGAWIAITDAVTPALPGAFLELRARRGPQLIRPRSIAWTSAPAFTTYADTPAELLMALAHPAGQRSVEQAAELRRRFVAVSPQLRGRRAELAALRKQLAASEPHTTVPIQRELPAGERRQAHVHIRGNHLAKGEAVEPGVPASFHPLAAGAPVDRLALARWLVSPDNPRTARVVVNRLWEQLFGVGLVATSEDFGVQGDRPSHPQLLDWLATGLVEGGWDLKATLRAMVTSATYRQASDATAARIQVDPDNRLLVRGPRVRLSAEMIRDQALSISGLLSPKMYGPPVRPPRPNLGLRAAFGGSTDWTTSRGEDRYRRALYTNWRRSLPYPSMVTFDAPSREVCQVRRSRTNTPLQALVTLNDPVYVEAAQALARRILRRGGADPRARATFGLRLCLLRPPTAAEVTRLVALFRDARARYAAAPQQAVAMATDPLGALPAGADVVEHAAWTVVANVLLNLDELIVKK